MSPTVRLAMGAGLAGKFEGLRSRWWYSLLKLDSAPRQEISDALVFRGPG